MNYLPRRSTPRFLDIIPLADHELPRILVADNDPLTAERLRSLTGGEAYSVVTVRDGREAYRILKTDADFSAVIIDITLPHLKGVEIVRYMKTEKRLARIPVLIISEDHGLRFIADSFAAGAIAFLPKPFSSMQLRRTLRIALSATMSRV
jgi:CheY-like chemotaxis protein